MFKKSGNEKRGRVSSPPRRTKQQDSSALKSQSFHYSARRVRSDQTTGRNEKTFNEETEAAKRPASPLLVKVLDIARKLTVLILIVALIFAVYLNGEVKVADVKRYDGDATAVEKFATNELKKSSILTRNNKLLINKSKLEESIKNEFLGIISVDASTRLNSDKVYLEIKMSRPTLLLSNGTNVYVVGEDGVILVDTKLKKGSFDTSKLPLVQDQSGIPLEIGKQALTIDQVKYVSDVSYQSERVGLMVDTMMMLPGGVELDVKYGGLQYFVKYNLFEDARQSTGAFLAMKEELDKKKQTPKEYIDVRISERAYVK